jgi:hypothetical protein
MRRIIGRYLSRGNPAAISLHVTAGAAHGRACALAYEDVVARTFIVRDPDGNLLLLAGPVE